jgi:hypothetical protein
MSHLLSAYVNCSARDLGYLDDLILIRMGIALAIRMVPPSVLAECRARAQEVMSQGKPVSRIAGAVIVVIWIAVAALFAVWAYENVAL